MSEARFAISLHVPSLIQSFPSLGLMHSAASEEGSVLGLWSRWEGQWEFLVCTLVLFKLSLPFHPYVRNNRTMIQVEVPR